MITGTRQYTVKAYDAQHECNNWSPARKYLTSYVKQGLASSEFTGVRDMQGSKFMIGECGSCNAYGSLTSNMDTHQCFAYIDKGLSDIVPKTQAEATTYWQTVGERTIDPNTTTFVDFKVVLGWKVGKDGLPHLHELMIMDDINQEATSSTAIQSWFMPGIPDPTVVYDTLHFRFHPADYTDETSQGTYIRLVYSLLMKCDIEVEGVMFHAYVGAMIFFEHKVKPNNVHEWRYTVARILNSLNEDGSFKADETGFFPSRQRIFSYELPNLDALMTLQPSNLDGVSKNISNSVLDKVSTYFVSR